MIRPEARPDGAPFRVGFCVSGRGGLFQSFVQHAHELGAVPAGLLLEHRADPALEAYCRKRCIPCHRLPRTRGAPFAEAIEHALETVEPDLLCLTFNRLLPPEVVRRRPGRIINLHMSLLPAYRGLHAIQPALDDGARISGGTVHEVDEGVDTGPIIAQCVVGVQPDMTPAALADSIYRLAHPMMLQVIRWFAEDRIVRDARGRLTVAGARYGALPVSPALEISLKNGVLAPEDNLPAADKRPQGRTRRL